MPIDVFVERELSEEAGDDSHGQDGEKCVNEPAGRNSRIGTVVTDVQS